MIASCSSWVVVIQFLSIYELPTLMAPIPKWNKAHILGHFNCYFACIPLWSSVNLWSELGVKSTSHTTYKLDEDYAHEFLLKFF